MERVEPNVSGPDAPRARRRVSRRRYMVRRVGALAVLVVLVAGVVSGVSLMASGDDQAASETPPPATDDDAEPPHSGETSDAIDRGTGAGAAATDSISDDAARPTETPPATEVAAEQRTPTADDPATVYIAGDSDAGMFGPYLQDLLAATGVTETVLDYHVSSGLARPDFFNWQEHLEQTIPEVDPDIVVVTFGGNDAQGLSEPDSSNYVVQPADVEPNEWREEYGARVGEVMDYLTEDGRTLIWVGIPNTESHDHTERLRIQDEVVRDQVEQRSGVRFVDAWQRFSGRDGGYAAYVIDPRDGQGKLVRANDQFHLNSTGAEILALDIAEVVRNALRERGADI